MRTEERYDILNRAKSKGQGILLEMPRAMRYQVYKRDVKVSV
jgi:hypothetical protein